MSSLAVVLTTLADGVPEDEDVVAGWTAFALFLLLIAAVAFLGWSLSKHLRRAQDNKDAGLFGDSPEEVEAVEPENHSAG